MDVAGVVLCGGKSSRMGTPKALLRVGEETFLERVVRVVHSVAQPIIIVAAQDQDLPPLSPFDVSILRDFVPDAGPVDALFRAMTNLSDDVDAVYLSSCDVPLLKPAFVRRVVESLGDDDIAIPKIGGRFHPLAAVYHTRTLAQLGALFLEDRRRMTDLLNGRRVRVLDERDFRDCDPDLDSLRNVNTPEDYRDALRRIRQ